LAPGFAHLQAGQLREAEIAFRSALQAAPGDAQAWMGLGLVAHKIGRFADALDCFDRALQTNTDFAAAHVNRGNTLTALGRFDEACAAFKRALALQPSLTSARINLASALHALGQLDAAVAELEQARAAMPESVDILNNLGNLYKDQGRVEEALAVYEQALAVDPISQVTFSNRLSLLKLDTRIDALKLRQAHESWSRWYAHLGCEAPLLANAPDSARRLKIGYVSPDAHTALPAFIDAVIAAHDRSSFEVFVYFNHPQPAQKIAALGSGVVARVMRGQDDAAVTRQIHADGIDLLIDIAGHTGHNRLGVFARKPAPVQMTWLDYLCTTGVEGIDYRITDAVADPPGSEVFHSEKLLRLPETQWCWTPPQDAPPVSELPMQRNGHITFGSFNHAQKLTDETLTLWRGILHAIPDAGLLVAGLQEGFARKRVREALRVDESRLEFMPRVSTADYRRAFDRVDVVLDPLPFSGATTTLDALYQGVPVLTLPGERSCSRSSASLLSVVGLNEWIAKDRADAISLATQACKDIDALAALRSGLRARVAGSAMCDVPRFVANLESAYRSAWHAWCASQTRDHELAKVRKLLGASEADEALKATATLCRHEPNWELAKVELVRAALAWGAAHPQAKAQWHQPFERAQRQRVSVIVCSIRPDYFSSLKISLAQQFAAHDFELIGIHDAKSLCEGFNRGAREAKGDVLVFCHDDISFVHADFGERVLAHLGHADVVGLAGASELVSGDWRHAGAPHLAGQILHRPPAGQEGFLYHVIGLHEMHASLKALDGVWLAMHRRVWETVRFDEQTFDGFHLYDVDFTYRAARAGLHLAAPHDLLLLHYSTGRYDATWQRYNRRFLAKFPELSNEPSARRHGAIHVKLQTLEQVDRVHAALVHVGFGALESKEQSLT
jgi:predicted O-linked N-acetylglucosamine transferase (SPINDLY family)